MIIKTKKAGIMLGYSFFKLRPWDCPSLLNEQPQTPRRYDIYSRKGHNHTTWHPLVALLWQGIEISQVSVCHEQALSKRLPKFYIVPSSRSNSRQSRLPYCHRHGIRLQMYKKLLTPQSFYKYFLRINKKYIVSCQLYARMYTYTVYLYKNY